MMEEVTRVKELWFLLFLLGVEKEIILVYPVILL